VGQVSRVARELVDSLVTNAAPKDRDVEREKAKERTAHLLILRSGRPQSVGPSIDCSPGSSLIGLAPTKDISRNQKEEEAMRKDLRMTITVAATAGLVLAAGPSALRAAVPDCRTTEGCEAPPGPNMPLREPQEIRSDGKGELRTVLDMRYFSGVNVFVRKPDECASDPAKCLLSLRAYGFPDPQTGKLRYTLPGPTYRVKKGDRFFLTLKNRLTAAPESPADKCNPENKGKGEFPNCYHGNNVSNFHFHGFHVSPQPPHDNIFLSLNPGEEYDLSSGEIPADQAEGTHWYHPHHHGATALQVLNGTAGAFIVEGPFDEWLNGVYKDRGGLEEQVMVIQQVLAEIPFDPKPQALLKAAPGPVIGGGEGNMLINGQLSPTVEIEVGEIQRWRFISATTRLSSMIEIRFPAGWDVRQIAMDGIRFAPENYRKQPLRMGNQTSGIRFELAPGNRADFLVKRTGAAKASVRWDLAEPRSLVKVNRKAMDKLSAAPLFSIAGAPRGERRQEMGFPSTLPPMPPYLANVRKGEVDGRLRDVAFGMKGEPENPNFVEFFIDERKFDPDCVDQRMKLGTAEQWTFTNHWQEASKELIAHPAHIHVNPFQVLERGNASVPSADCTEEEVESGTCHPIWQDTIALPTSASEKVVIRQRYVSFSGNFVMHCHILGHEDQGMMQRLEIGDESGCAICPDHSGSSRCKASLMKLHRPPGIRPISN
jgi:FtsP/CotA-like multicopper oxidase with cupredoxin domain